MLFPDNKGEPRIVVRKSFTTNPVFVDGPSRAGKAVISIAVSSLERAEHIQIRPMLESIFVLKGLGLIDKDTAVELLIREVDMYLYFNYLGRHINTNIHDMSGVWNSRDPEMYLKRLMEKDSPSDFLRIMRRIEKEKPIVPFHTHEIFCDPEIFLEPFVNSKFILSFRHPVEVVSTWDIKGGGERYGVDPRIFHHTVWGPGQPVPWWAFDWAEQYESLSPLERIIKSVYVLNQRYYANLDSAAKKYQERILTVCFEHFVIDPDSGIKRIAEFLATTPSPATKNMLFRQSVPRELDLEGFRTKYLAIKEQAPKEMFALFRKDCELYEKRFMPGISVENIRSAGASPKKRGRVEDKERRLPKDLSAPAYQYGAFRPEE